MRLFVYCVYLGALFALGGLVYQRLAAFEGYLAVGLGASERVVVSPSIQGEAFFGSHRNMPLDVIRFADRRAAQRAFDDKLMYNVAHLPFRVRLKETEVLSRFPPRDELVLRGPDAIETHPVRVNDEVPMGEHRLRVAAIRPWAGLVRNPGGGPMAAVALRTGEAAWGLELFAPADEWVLDPAAAVLLRWFESEDTARTAAADMPPGMDAGRWGALDGPRVHWSTAFMPGTGFTLQDGTEVTLMAVNADPPAIAVALERAGERRVVQVRANDPAPDSPVRYEHPGHAEAAFVLHAWRDATALVTAWRRGQKVGETRLDEGDAWETSGLPRALRLDQVMQSALPVTPRTEADRAVQEIVLLVNGERLQLREGQRGSHEAWGLHYRRVPVPPRVRHTLTAHYADDSTKTARLDPGGRVRFGDWVFTQDPDFVHAAEVARLNAWRTMGGPARLLGMAMVVFGAFGWVIIRFRRARPVHERGRADWSDLREAQPPQDGTEPERDENSENRGEDGPGGTA